VDWAPTIERLLSGRRGRTNTVERLIGSTRRECLDHMIVLGGSHLRSYRQVSRIATWLFAACGQHYQSCGPRRPNRPGRAPRRPWPGNPLSETFANYRAKSLMCVSAVETVPTDPPKRPQNPGPSASQIGHAKGRFGLVDLAERKLATISMVLAGQLAGRDLSSKYAEHPAETASLRAVSAERGDKPPCLREVM
jgi:hypothetical protein